MLFFNIATTVWSTDESLSEVIHVVTNSLHDCNSVWNWRISCQCHPMLPAHSLLDCNGQSQLKNLLHLLISSAQSLTASPVASQFSSSIARVSKPEKNLFHNLMLPNYSFPQLQVSADKESFLDLMMLPNSLLPDHLKLKNLLISWCCPIILF